MRSRRRALSPDPDLVWGDSFRFEAGVDAAHRYLAAAAPPTAVFAAADDAAIGFIRTVRDAGIRTPDDVSVVGFDDIEYANVIEPAVDHHAPAARRSRPLGRDRSPPAHGAERPRSSPDADAPALQAGRPRKRPCYRPGANRASGRSRRREAIAARRRFAPHPDARRRRFSGRAARARRAAASR